MPIFSLIFKICSLAPFSIHHSKVCTRFILWTIILVNHRGLCRKRKHCSKSGFFLRGTRFLTMFYFSNTSLLSAERERKRELSLFVRTSSNFCTCPKIWKSINSSPPLREGLTVQWVLGQLCIDIFSWTKVLIGEGTRLSVRAKVRDGTGDFH